MKQPVRRLFRFYLSLPIDVRKMCIRDRIVKVKDDARDEIEKIRNLMVDTNDGRKVPLSYVACLLYTSKWGGKKYAAENFGRHTTTDTWKSFRAQRLRSSLSASTLSLIHILK